MGGIQANRGAPARAVAALGALAGGALLAACPGLSKAPDAIAGSDSAYGYLFGVCPASTTYRNSVEPVLQSKCAVCHGGSGMGDFAMNVGSSLDDSRLAANYAEALAHLADDDFGDSANNPILMRPLQRQTHPLKVFGELDPEYAVISSWIDEERTTPCTR